MMEIGGVKYYSTQETADMLHISKRALLEGILARGEMEACRVGRGYQFAESDIAAYIQQGKGKRTEQSVAKTWGEARKRTAKRKARRWGEKGSSAEMPRGSRYIASWADTESDAHEMLFAAPDGDSYYLNGDGTDIENLIVRGYGISIHGQRGVQIISPKEARAWAHERLNADDMEYFLGQYGEEADN